MKTGEADREDAANESHRFLTEKRIEQVADRIAPLLRRDLSWVERRKERVTILDEAALHRQISVDFSLRRETEPLPDVPGPENGERLYCAPLFVLQKAPANLLGFDLCDEAGRSLRLTSRHDNARISAATMRVWATLVLGEANMPMPPALGDEIERIACSDAMAGSHLATRLLARPGDFEAEVAVLQNDHRFTWWLSTIGHSSLVVVLFRSPAPQRKLVKLSIEQPIAKEARRPPRLGWNPYRVVVELPLIEARTYHLEAQAPPGLSIVDAVLRDDEHADSVKGAGDLHRNHLYQPGAQRSGAGTATLRLQVAAGFRGGAVIAAGLATAAMAACWWRAGTIAGSPTSAPALLLVIPGLIATYVARPDAHPLTSRLLNLARRLVMVVGGLAYLAAAVVALSGAGHPEHSADRAESLRWWLAPITAFSALLFVLLTVTYLRGRIQPRERWKSRGFSDRRLVARAEDGVVAHLGSETIVPEGYELVTVGSTEIELSPSLSADKDSNTSTPESDHAQPSVRTVPELLYIKQRWYGDWVLYLRVVSDDASPECELMANVVFVSRVAFPPSAVVLRREAEEVERFLKAVETWSLTD